MARYVPDIHTGRWIVLSPKRNDRPDQFVKTEEVKKCPFCPGNEKMTPPEVFRVGGGGADEPGWEVRVVPNLYPITDIHEVIIHSTDEFKDFEDFENEHIVKILNAFRQRFNTYREQGQVLIFTNHGASSGASQVHPHSQLVVVPYQIKLDSLSLEPIQNIVSKDDFFVSYCPDFSQWPYEIWLAPKRENTFFGDINDEEVKSLAFNLKRNLNKLRTIFSKEEIKKQYHLQEFSYNIYIYPLKNWYMRIIPRTLTRAGFELGTGIQLNLVDGCDASQELVLT